MNDLFQDYVAARLARALHGRLDVVAEPKVHLGAGGRLAMRPDLTFRRPGGRGRDPCVYVGDVKYKLASGPARLSDYYQLLAYATALGLDDGVLVYAQRPDPGAATASEDSEIADDLGDEPVHTVRIVNTSTRLHVYRLPLTGTNAQVEAGVDQLAEWILRRVPRSTAISA
jgi:5-methylcytosine-specific restriction enzyme subunit McrC